MRSSPQATSWLSRDCLTPMEVRSPSSLKDRLCGVVVNGVSVLVKEAHSGVVCRDKDSIETCISKAVLPRVEILELA